MRAPILLVRNNFQDSFSKFGIEITTDPSDLFKTASLDNNLTEINKDLPRQMFLSDRYSYKNICERWRNAVEQSSYAYMQGDMTGGALAPNLYLFLVSIPLSKDPKFLLDHNEIDAFCSEGDPRLCFGYINDQGETSGFVLSYNRFKPSQWMVSILHRATAPFKERELSTYLHEVSFPTEKKQYWTTSGNIFRTLQSKSIATLLKPLFNLRKVSIDTDFVAFLLPYIRVAKCNSPSAIMLENPKYYPIGEHQINKDLADDNPIMDVAAPTHEDLTSKGSTDNSTKKGLKTEAIESTLLTQSLLRYQKKSKNPTHQTGTHPNKKGEFSKAT